jgi:hypothetical protein
MNIPDEHSASSNNRKKMCLLPSSLLTPPLKRAYIKAYRNQSKELPIAKVETI